MDRKLLLKIGVLAAVIFLTALLVRTLTPPKELTSILSRGVNALEKLTSFLEEKSDRVGAIPGSQAPELFCIGGSCEYHHVVNVAGGTTTSATKLNPFNATSTASVRILGFGASSTVQILAGTSTSKYLVSTQGNSSPGVSASLLNVKVATDSVADLISGTRNVNYGVGSAGKGAILSEVNTYSEIIVGPAEYVSVHASSTDLAEVVGTETKWGLSDIGARASGTVEIIFKTIQGQKK